MLASLTGDRDEARNELGRSRGLMKSHRCTRRRQGLAKSAKGLYRARHESVPEITGRCGTYPALAAAVHADVTVLDTLWADYAAQGWKLISASWT